MPPVRFECAVRGGGSFGQARYSGGIIRLCWAGVMVGWSMELRKNKTFSIVIPDSTV